MQCAHTCANSKMPNAPMLIQLPLEPRNQDKDPLLAPHKLSSKWENTTDLSKMTGSQRLFQDIRMQLLYHKKCSRNGNPESLGSLDCICFPLFKDMCEIVSLSSFLGQRGVEWASYIPNHSKKSSLWGTSDRCRMALFIFHIVILLLLLILICNLQFVKRNIRVRTSNHLICSRWTLNVC